MRGARSDSVLPGPAERRLLTRFYLAVGLSRALYLIYPFEFAYLYLVMDRPEWSVLPLIVSSATALAAQLPTGALADRWSRKACVLTGAVLVAATFVVVPSAARLSGGWQLLAVCGAFALTGLGETLMAGAQEAWVVDNLHFAGRADLIDAFFARTYSVTSVGGVLAGVAAVTILVVAHVDQALLDLLWYATAAGFLAAAVVAAGIRERRIPADPLHPDGGSLWARMGQALRILGRRKPLLLLTIAMIIASLSSAAADEAFPVSLLTKGLDARALGPLSIAEDLFGVAAPLLGLLVARRVGAEPLLSVTLAAAGAFTLVLFASQAVGVVIALYVLLGFLDRMWDPVALARLQEDIPSAHRATLSSLVYQASGLAELGGLGLFALMLGSHSRELREATPDLVDAFSGHAHVSVPAPTGWFGLAVPDVAIVVFVLAGAAAVPFVVAAARTRRMQRPPRPPDRPRAELPVH